MMRGNLFLRCTVLVFFLEENMCGIAIGCYVYMICFVIFQQWCSHLCNGEKMIFVENRSTEKNKKITENIVIS